MNCNSFFHPQRVSSSDRHSTSPWRNAVMLGVALLACSWAASADTLLVERVEKQQNSAMPRRGMTMNQVEGQYGMPANKRGAIGKPPITRWDYPAFAVYFEHSHVINSVALRADANEIMVKPVNTPNR